MVASTEGLESAVDMGIVHGNAARVVLEDDCILAAGIGNFRRVRWPLDIDLVILPCISNATEPSAVTIRAIRSLNFILVMHSVFWKKRKGAKRGEMIQIWCEYRVSTTASAWLVGGVDNHGDY